MDTIVLKFGGSSVADNIKLNVVAEKIIDLKKQAKNIVAVVSAQGKTTNNLINQAKELSAIPEEREMDALMATGEQVTASKLSMLLNRKGYKTISLTGWQAGIKTSQVHKNARIEEINTSRIKRELEEGKIVIVAGFQGINENSDITTLGRGGSDTTAVALANSLKADKCYIFSDVDGIYSADPNMITIAKRLDQISFNEMQEIADAGAKVLHNRCIQISKKFGSDIIAKSTFSDEGGTTVCKGIETTEVKSLIKNSDLVKIEMTGKLEEINSNVELEICQKLCQNHITIEAFQNQNEKQHIVTFRMPKAELNKVQNLLENEFPQYEVRQYPVIKLSIVGYGITQDEKVLSNVILLLKKYQLKIENINLAQAKIEVLLQTEIDNKMLKELHEKLITNS